MSATKKSPFTPKNRISLALDATTVELPKTFDPKKHRLTRESFADRRSYHIWRAIRLEESAKRAREMAAKGGPVSRAIAKLKEMGLTPEEVAARMAE